VFTCTDAFVDTSRVSLEGAAPWENFPYIREEGEKGMRGLGVSSGNTVVWVEEGRVGQPETTVGGESSGAKSIASRELPHSSSKLSKATDEAGHADDSVGDSNTPSVNVVHRKDEGRASEGEETKRARVTDDPQLRGGVVDIGMTGEGARSVSTLLIDRVLLECGGHLER
jgi:hypothetical protein